MADSSLDKASKEKGLSSVTGFFVRVTKEKPLGAIGGIVTLLLLLIAIFADVLAPYGMNETNMAVMLQAPSATHLLGTDNLGRDIFSRIIFGARVSIIIGLSATVISIIISLFVGLLCGYIGGVLDLGVQRVVDAIMSIPQLILMMIVVAILGAGFWQVTLALSVPLGIIGSRVIRSAVISIKENVYVGAANAIGCSVTRILFRHILPNIMAPTIVLFSVRVPAVIMNEAALSFLGFGIPPPTPSWGGMLSGQARVYMLQAPWMAIWPGLALAVVVYSINMFGDAVRDILDPRLRGGAGRYGMRAKK